MKSLENEVEVSLEEQIKLLELRIVEQDQELKRYHNSDNRLYVFERTKTVQEQFGLSVEQGEELKRFVKSILYSTDGNPLRCFEKIENAPIPIREQFFAVFLVMSAIAPSKPDLPPFLKSLFGG